MSLYYPQTVGEIEVIRHWVNSQLDDEVDNTEVFTVAVLDNDTPNKILAGAVFSNYSKNNVFLSGAITKEGIGKVTRECLSDMLYVAFRKPWNCLRITALVSETNKRSQRFMRGLGFTHEGTLRDYLEEGKNTLVYGLTKTDYLGGTYGRRKRRRGSTTGLRTDDSGSSVLQSEHADRSIGGNVLESRPDDSYTSELPGSPGAA